MLTQCIKSVLFTHALCILTETKGNNMGYFSELDIELQESKFEKSLNLTIGDKVTREINGEKFVGTVIAIKSNLIKVNFGSIVLPLSRAELSLSL